MRLVSQKYVNWNITFQGNQTDLSSVESDESEFYHKDSRWWWWWGCWWWELRRIPRWTFPFVVTPLQVSKYIYIDYIINGDCVRICQNVLGTCVCFVNRIVCIIMNVIMYLKLLLIIRQKYFVLKANLNNQLLHIVT